MNEVTIFLCDPWESYIRQLERESEEQYVRYEAELDLEHERELGRAWLSGEGECPWPWYADRPYAVQRSKIVKR